jgi:hypothetical protein
VESLVLEGGRRRYGGPATRSIRWPVALLMQACSGTLGQPKSRALVLARGRRRGRRVGMRRRESGVQQVVDNSANLGNQMMAWSSRRGEKEMGRWRRRGRCGGHMLRSQTGAGEGRW